LKETLYLIWVECLVFGEAFLLGEASLAGLVDFLITDPIKAEAPVPV